MIVVTVVFPTFQLILTNNFLQPILYTQLHDRCINIQSSKWIFIIVNRQIRTSFRTVYSFKRRPQVNCKVQQPLAVTSQRPFQREGQLFTANNWLYVWRRLRYTQSHRRKSLQGRLKEELDDFYSFRGIHLMLYTNT